MVTGLSAQLQHIFVDLPQSGSTYWLPIGKATAICIDGHAAINVSRTLLDECFLFTVFTEAVLSHMHDLSSNLGIL